MSLEDTMFGCAETPLWIPPLADKSSIQVCRSCTLRLTAKIAGPGNCSETREGGLYINENPMTSLAVNGIPHNLVFTLMLFPGAHRLFDREVPSDAELYCLFQNSSNPNIRILLCLPVDIGEDPSNKYFSTLGTEIRKDRPTLATLFSEDAEFLSYKGAPTFGRNAQNPRLKDFCDPIRIPMTHYVSLTPTFIQANDFLRLRSMVSKDNAPPKPLADVTQARLTKLATLVKGMRIDSQESDKAGGISTAAMKCYRLNPEKDIVNNRVYVGGKNKPGVRTLANELERAASDMSSTSVPPSSIQPRDIERIVGIVLGVTIGVVLCATVAVLLWNGTFTNYLNAQKLYNNPVSASKLSMKLPALPRVCP